MKQILRDAQRLKEHNQEESDARAPGLYNFISLREPPAAPSLFCNTRDFPVLLLLVPYVCRTLVPTSLGTAEHHFYLAFPFSQHVPGGIPPRAENGQQSGLLLLPILKRLL